MNPATVIAQDELHFDHAIRYCRSSAVRVPCVGNRKFAGAVWVDGVCPGFVRIKAGYAIGRTLRRRRSTGWRRAAEHEVHLGEFAIAIEMGQRDTLALNRPAGQEDLPGNGERVVAL